MYFASYSHLKKVVADENGKNSVPSLLLAGTAAGVVCAAAVTPADVIKTRLQAQASRVPGEGQAFYKGIPDCFVRTLSEEGPKALFKGVVPRVLIVSHRLPILYSICKFSPFGLLFILTLFFRLHPCSVSR
jgi:solute carrier family 25 aspartate/glutamate transporter 12/13